MSSPSVPPASGVEREAGAPEAGIELTPDEREALEQAFFDWWGDNYHTLVLGGSGDLLNLRSALNAAYAKIRSSRSETSSASCNALHCP